MVGKNLWAKQTQNNPRVIKIKKYDFVKKNSNGYQLRTNTTKASAVAEGKNLNQKEIVF